VTTLRAFVDLRRYLLQIVTTLRAFVDLSRYLLQVDLRIEELRMP